ncbi:MAG: OmpA family protein [Nitrospirales bacterium]|nr:OmpA family protein [Nitrospirales bacterium]
MSTVFGCRVPDETDDLLSLLGARMFARGVDVRYGAALSWIYSLIVAGGLGFTGCSSFHEVTVVSHGVQNSEPALSSEAEDIPAPALEPIHAPEPALELSEPLSAPKPIAAQPATEEGTTEIMVESVEESVLPRTLQDVFFEFDQYLIQPEAIKILELNAKVLKVRYPDRELILQGHCDERGTEEYNLILGERRAAAVRNFLKDLGVSPANLRILSLGKMQPFCLLRTVECFRKNRRVHFVLK